MQKAADIFYRMCLVLALFFSGVIFWLSLNIIDGTQPKYQLHGEAYIHILAAASACILLAAALILVYRRFGKWLQKRSISFLLFLILISVQVLFLIYVSHPMYTTDTLKTQNEAAAMLVSQNGMLNMDSSYFQRYPNNHFIVVLFYCYFYLLHSLGITQFWIPAVVLNMICIDSAVLLSYVSAGKIWNRKAANLFLILCLFCPTTYMWLTFTYTNTVSMPFVMGVLYLFLQLQKPCADIRQILFSIGLGICIVIGYKIRPTTLLPVIAMVLYALMKGIWLKKKGQLCIGNQFIKGVLAISAGIMTAFFVTMLLNKHVPKGYEDKSLPATHWMMMGLNEESDGGFIKSDVVFSEQFPTKAEKTAAHVKEIKKRLSKMGLGGYIDLLGRKLRRVWAEGSDSAFYKSAYASDFPVLYEQVMGRRNIGVRVYTQGFRAAAFLFICISSLALLMRRNKKDVFVYTLTLLGCFAFFLLWEANTKYNICFIYLCLLLMADGIQMAGTGLACAGRRSRAAAWILGRRGLAGKLSLWLGCGALLCVSTYGCVVSGCNIRQVYQTELKGKGSWSRELLEQASCITQTIQDGQKTNKYPFNELELVFEPSDTPKAKDRYHAAVYSMPSGQVLYEADIKRKDVRDHGMYLISADMVQKPGDSYYVLELRHYGEKYSMYPCLQNSAYLDMYPYGRAAVDGQTLDCDLRFSLYQNSLAGQ